MRRMRASNSEFANRASSGLDPVNYAKRGETDPRTSSATMPWPENFAAVRRVLPQDLSVIELVNELDAPWREFLREIFQDLGGRGASLRKSASEVARPSVTRSARISPTTLANLNP